MGKQVVLTVGGIRIGDAFCTGNFIPDNAKEGKVVLVCGDYAKEAWIWQLDNAVLGNYVDTLYCLDDVRFPMDSSDYGLFYDRVVETNFFCPVRHEVIPYSLDYQLFKSPIWLKESFTLSPTRGKVGIQSRSVSEWKNQENIEKVKYYSARVVSFETKDTTASLPRSANYTRFESDLSGAISEMATCSFFVGAASSLTLIAAKLMMPTITCHYNQASVDYAGCAWNGKSIDLLNPSVKELQESVNKMWELHGAV